MARATQLHAQKVGELEQSLKRTKPLLTDMTNGIQGLVGAGGGLAYVTNEAIKFKSAMAQVKKVTDATLEQINALSGSLKEMAAIAAETFATFEVGHGMGTWLYENVGFAQNLGDNMAKVIAYMDAMATDRTFEDVNREFRTTNE